MAVPVAVPFFDVYICFFECFFEILVGKKYILGIAISPLKSINCILLSLVSIGWISNFMNLGDVLSLKIVFTPRFVAKK
jgi:hypothetical protein